MDQQHYLCSKTFFKFYFNGNIVDLQCCVSFRCMYSKVIVKYTHKYIFPYILFQILFPYRLLQNIEYSSLCYTVGPGWLYILYIIQYCIYVNPRLLIYLSPLKPFRNTPSQTYWLKICIQVRVPRWFGSTLKFAKFPSGIPLVECLEKPVPEAVWHNSNSYL